MAIRRTVKSCAPASFGPSDEAARRLRMNGMTMSFDTMIASATDSTITIAVAADSPPTKATSVNSSDCARSGSASTNMSASVPPFGNVSRPAIAIGITNRLISTR